jgi:hypothetical protein
MSAAAFRALLEAGDVGALRAAWGRVAAHLPQPETQEQAEIVMHHARTSSESVSFKARAYSHRWLTERALPSGLPDELRHPAERLYPTVVDAVGISVRASNPMLKDAAVEVQRAMSDAVEEAYTEGRKDPVFVQARMAEARSRAWRSVLG